MSTDKTQLTNEEFLALVSGDISNIADLPDFIQPIPGTYMVGIDKAEVAGVEDNKPYIDIKMRLISIVEQTSGAEEYPEGSPLGFRFYGDMGIKRFKKLMAPLFEATGTNTIGALLDAMPNMEVGIVTSQRKDKDDETKKYTDLKLVVIP